MAGINKVIIIGSLGNDIDLKYSTDGRAIANLSIATSDKWTDKSGHVQEKTEWHRVSIFGKLAEIAGQYLHKGSKVYIEGRLQTRKWQDKNGDDRYTTEVVCREMQMLDKRESGDASAANNTPNTQQSQSSQNDKSDTQNKAVNDDFDDDIPF